MKHLLKLLRSQAPALVPACFSSFIQHVVFSSSFFCFLLFLFVRVGVVLFTLARFTRLFTTLAVGVILFPSDWRCAGVEAREEKPQDVDKNPVQSQDHSLTDRALDNFYQILSYL